jgi:polyhydroxybutyrate depolymerase
MTSVRAFAVLLLVATAAGSASTPLASEPAARTPSQGQLQAPGQAPGLVRQSWTVDGVERTALVAIPRATPAPPGAAAVTVPLVVVFHGHGGSSANAARSFRLHQAWPEALAIYPQGLPTVGALTDPEGRLPGWQQTPGVYGDRDLHLADAMLEWAKSHFAIDPARVFAAGHSNGGSMVYLLWAVRGDQFAAFAPSSSVFRLNLIASAKAKPAFIIAGRQDALVPFAAQQASLAAVLRLDKAASDGTAWSGGASAQKHASSAGTDVIAYIHPGGHPMPDDAGALIARFFKSIAPPGGGR